MLRYSMRVTDIKDVNIKNTLFHSRTTSHGFRPKKYTKERTVYLFTIAVVTLFTLEVILIDQFKKKVIQL